MLKIFKQYGSISQTKGHAISIIVFALSLLCLLGVVAFYFPEYMTTPDVRKKYSVQHLRYLLLGVLLFCLTISSLNLIFKRFIGLNLSSLTIVGVCFLLGGHQVPVSDFADNTPYIGLDFFILDLFFSALFFSVLEKIKPIRAQNLFRKYWQTDLVYFAFNHLAIGLVLFIINYFVNQYFAAHQIAPFKNWVSGQNYFLQLFLAMFMADITQYVIHYSYHKIPFLWRIHAIHHSIEELDWLAGSRLHVFEVLMTRTFVLGVLILLGFNKNVIDIYIVIVGFQAVLNHANIKIPEAFNQAPLKYIFVTPQFHHWHHSQERVAIDKNFASHFAFIDYFFGTQVKTLQSWPQQYGVKNEQIPDGFFRQHFYIFRSQNKTNTSN